MTIVGPATVDLWVKSSAPVEDFQVTVTEARPATSEEEYITSGFLRSSNQVDRSDSTHLFTDPSYLAGEARSLSRRSDTLVKIPVDPVAHTFRPGTELRIVISAPGGDRPSWEFDTLDHGQTATVGLGGIAASALVVNEVSRRAQHRHAAPVWLAARRAMSDTSGGREPASGFGRLILAQCHGSRGEGLSYSEATTWPPIWRGRRRASRRRSTRCRTESATSSGSSEWLCSSSEASMRIRSVRSRSSLRR